MKRLVGWQPVAKAQLRAIDRATAIEILEAIDHYLVSGQGDVKPLRPPLAGLRLRVGDWRVLFKPTKDDRAIVIDRVAHRSAAYRQ